MSAAIESHWQWWQSTGVLFVIVSVALVLLAVRALWLRHSASQLAVDCGDECDDVRNLFLFLFFLSLRLILNVRFCVAQSIALQKSNTSLQCGHEDHWGEPRHSAFCMNIAHDHIQWSFAHSLRSGRASMPRCIQLARTHARRRARRQCARGRIS